MIGVFTKILYYEFFNRTSTQVRLSQVFFILSTKQELHQVFICFAMNIKYTNCLSNFFFLLKFLVILDQAFRNWEV